MSVTMYPDYPQDWKLDGNPNGTVINLGQGGTLHQYDVGIDTADGILWECVNIGTLDINAQTITGSIWQRLSVKTQIGLSRSYNSESISFGISRTPNVTYDIFVVCTVQMSNTLLQTSEIDVQIDSGSGFSTIASVSLSGVAITKNDVLSFIVPANCSYQLVSSGTGSNSIVSNFELSL